MRKPKTSWTVFGETLLTGLVGLAVGSIHWHAEPEAFLATFVGLALIADRIRAQPGLGRALLVGGASGLAFGVGSAA